TMKKLLFIATLLFIHTIPTQAQLGKTIGGLLNKDSGNEQASNLSENEIVKGLKEAVSVGIQNGAKQASSLDGFLKNEAIKLVLPREVETAGSTLRNVGLGNAVDQFIVSLNRAAEDAAQESVPICTQALTSMPIQDALGILKGAATAA